MSTRAIIGVKNADGSITGAWCWCDGYDIKDMLLKSFTTAEDVEFLLAQGMFETIMSQEGVIDYVDFLKKNGLASDDKKFICYKNAFIMSDKRHEDRAAEVYRDIDTASGQDINVLYLFENEQWLMYKHHPASKEIPVNLTERKNRRKTRKVRAKNEN